MLQVHFCYGGRVGGRGYGCVKGGSCVGVITEEVCHGDVCWKGVEVHACVGVSMEEGEGGLSVVACVCVL